MGITPVESRAGIGLPGACSGQPARVEELDFPTAPDIVERIAHELIDGFVAAGATHDVGRPEGWPGTVPP